MHSPTHSKLRNVCVRGGCRIDTAERIELGIQHVATTSTSFRVHPIIQVRSRAFTYVLGAHKSAYVIPWSRRLRTSAYLTT